LYLRCLIQLQAQRIRVANSVQIAEIAGTNAAQVRKDFSYLGEYGVRGQGYQVDELIEHLTHWLGMQSSRNVAIVGFGRLGSALRGYGGFQDRGFSISAVFDADSDKVGTMIADGVVVEPLERMPEVVAEQGIEIAILTVPVDVVQDVADRVVASGIRAILNFAPVGLDVAEGVIVRQADVAGELQILSYHLSTERDG
jgi:redox-sensing transcriptional repressor